MPHRLFFCLIFACALATSWPREAQAEVRHCVTASGQTSWHGFAEAIFAGAVARGLLARAPSVVPIGTADYPTPAARPGYSVLDTGALQRDFGIELPDWQAALARVMDELAA